MEPPDERTTLIQKLSNGNKRAARFSILCFYTLLFFSSIWFLNYLKSSNEGSKPDFSHLHHSILCPGLEPIGVEEFGARRMSLGNLLSEGNNKWGVYLSEPSPNTIYYANLSLSNWYLSERPFLFAISPSVASDGAPSSHLSILTPSFELSRAKLLPFAFTTEEFKEISFVVWQEEGNPYEILVDHLETLRKENQDLSSKKSESWSIQIEENVRQFISSGLSDAVASLQVDARVEFASLRVREQRMRKSEGELQIMRCAARVTLESLRAVRTHLSIGMSEKEGESLILDAMTSAGLSGPLDVIVLFGANAALPHASASSSKRLEIGEFALFDVGGNLLGYQSDITRTMLPDLDSGDRNWPNDRARKIWETVKEAQEAALTSLETKVVRAMDVDRAARDVIEREGWGIYFGHRLGHGGGLQTHEHPYLNSGNPQILKTGECCSNEPGIYIESGVDKEGDGIGVRLEDMWRRIEAGYELLTGSPLALSPWEP